MRPEVLVVTISLATGLDFEDMFDLAPVSLWMEDYSDLKQLFDAWRAAGVTDLLAFLDSDAVAPSGWLSAVAARARYAAPINTTSANATSATTSAWRRRWRKATCWAGHRCDAPRSTACP